MRLTKLELATAEVYTCVFAPDGSRALIGAQGKPVTLWNLVDGSLVQSYEHTGAVWALAWGSDERFFLSLDGTMRLWDVAAGLCVRDFAGRAARCVAWDEDRHQ